MSLRPVTYPCRPTIPPRSCGGGTALRRTVVVAENATEALPPPNGAGVLWVSHSVNQLVAETLMIALAMMGRGELNERATEVPLTERNRVIGGQSAQRPDLRRKEIRRLTRRRTV